MGKNRTVPDLQIEILDCVQAEERQLMDAELLYVMEGELELQIGERCVRLPREGIYIVNAGDTCRFRAEGKVLYLLLRIRTQAIADMTNNPLPVFWCDSTREDNQRYDAVRRLLKRLLGRYLSAQEKGEDFGYLAVCYQVLEELTGNFMPRFADRERSDDQSRFEERMAQIVQYLNQNYSSSVSSKELAEKLYLSQGYLSRFFKKYFGMSFAEYLSGVRLRHAVEDLVYTNHPITRIAFDNGFANVAALNKAFREGYGGTPSAMRKELRDKSQGRVEDTQVQKKLEHYLSTQGQDWDRTEEHGALKAQCSVAQSIPLMNAWQDMLNVGSASELLRSEVREHLIDLAKLLKVRYVRFWNLFSPEMLLDPNSERSYNFSKLDSILDFLMEHNLKPHLELGWKPKRLLRSVNHVIEEGNAISVNEDRLVHFTQAMIKHLLRRYRQSEINTWRLELWLDEDTYGDGEKEETYFRTFNKIYKTIKQYADGQKVGGCGLRCDYLDFHGFGTDFFQRWKQQPCQPDFISASFYAYERGDIQQDHYAKRSTDNEAMLHHITLIHQVLALTKMDEIPLYITEWNLTISDRNFLNDTCFKGAYIIKNMLDTYGQAESMAYFEGSDRVAEHYDSDGPFYGGRGLLSKDGVLKPAGYALRFLKWLYGEYVSRGENYLVTTDGHNDYGIICHNQKVLNYNYYLSPEDEVEKENIWKYFEDQLPLEMVLTLEDVQDGSYQVKTYRIHEGSGSPLRAWEGMGYETELTRNDAKYLRRVCAPRLTIQTMEAKDGCLPLQFTMESNEICFIRIRKIE